MKDEKKKPSGNMFISYGKTEAVNAPSSPSGYFPSLTLTDKAVPELMDKKIGDMCEVIIKGKVKGINAQEGGDTRIEFEVHNAEYGKHEKSEKNEYDKEKVGKAAGMMKKIKSMRKY
jgi:hypothetical protein